MILQWSDVPVSWVVHPWNVAECWSCGGREARVTSIAEGGEGLLMLGEYLVGEPSLRNPGKWLEASCRRLIAASSELADPRKVA